MEGDVKCSGNSGSNSVRVVKKKNTVNSQKYRVCGFVSTFSLTSQRTGIVLDSQIP